VPLNELYGLTEADLVLGNCSEIMRTKPGSLGKSVPGHRVEVMDESGHILPANALGEIAVESFGDPVIFLGYWKNPEATRQKFRSGWFLTGDVGYRDAEGYFWFIGRNDDVIKTAAYRLGPAEVEEAINAHPAVLECGVVGREDADRGTVIRAYVVLRQNYDPGEATRVSIQDFVKDKLAAYAYPRDVEFIASLPKTSTGKIMRGELRRMASGKG
jgi:acetyl-CoA synthetase